MSARACSAISTEMEAHLDDAGFGGNFLIVQSTGGLFDVGDARQSCIRMLESGPAAGVVGTKALCDSHRHRRTPSPSTWAAPPPRPA